MLPTSLRCFAGGQAPPAAHIPPPHRYVTEGLVTDYEVKEWSTVVGTVFPSIGANEAGGHDEPMPEGVHTSS